MANMRKEYRDLSRCRDTDLAYFAGILDGEGCIWAGLKSGKYATPIVRVQVTTTDVELCVWLRDLFGGSVTEHSNKKAEANGRKRVDYWCVHSQEAAYVLRAVLPHLKLKRRQAELAIELEERKGSSIYWLEDGEFEARQEIVDNIRDLKAA